MRILMVDDEESVVIVLKQILSKDPSFELESTTSSLTAFKMMRENKYDALLCDMAMPEMTGEELIHALKKEGICPPFVMLMSGIVKPMAEMLDENFVFIEKPFAPIKIIETLREARTRLKFK